MMSQDLNAELSADAAGLRLCRISGERLILCEPVLFTGRRAAVEVTLRRARISGRVEFNGEIKNHFADVMDVEGSIVDTVALDAKSYGALKNHWMRCKVENDGRE
jgi:hypothetical protein